MKGIITNSLIGVAAIVLLLSAAGCAGVTARTEANVGVYGGEPIVYPLSTSKLVQFSKEVLTQQGYMIVSEDAKELRAVRHKKLWEYLQSTDMTIGFTELKRNTTRIDILSKTGSDKSIFNLQEKYVKDFLRALREKIRPEPEQAGK